MRRKILVWMMEAADILWTKMVTESVIIMRHGVLDAASAEEEEAVWDAADFKKCKISVNM